VKDKVTQGIDKQVCETQQRPCPHVVHLLQSMPTVSKA